MDNRKDCHSLLKLLSNIERRSSDINTKWFLEQWPGGSVETKFKEFFGNNNHVKKQVIQNHIEELKRVTRAICERTNIYEAHNAKKKDLKIIPTYRDVDVAVDTIKVVYAKYWYLLKQGDLSI